MQPLINTTLSTFGMRDLHPLIVPHVHNLHRLSELADLSGWDVEVLHGYFDKHPEIRASYDWLQRCALPQVKGAFVVPYLSPEFCDRVCLEMIDKDFQRNADEEEEYQIDELVLGSEMADLYRTCAYLFDTAMVPVLHVAHCVEPACLTAIQVARYNPAGVAHGNWHMDADSDQTVVVTLNTGAFEGGGTELWIDADTVMHVPPLPKGHALVFLGKTTLHRGLHVPNGDRMLLVHWTELKQQEWADHTVQ
jgi:hypothetical protein